MARTHRGRLVEVTKRVTSWISSTRDTSFTNLAASTAILDQSFSRTDPFTVVRTRGLLVVKSDQIANGEEPFGSLGMAVVSDEAAAIGVTAMPTPFTDAASDLFFLHLDWAMITEVNNTNITNTPWIQTFDSKAMRKVNENETIAVTIENGHTGFGVQFELLFRMLIKLH